jgi:hypothetical protein
MPDNHPKDDGDSTSSITSLMGPHTDYESSVNDDGDSLNEDDAYTHDSYHNAPVVQHPRSPVRSALMLPALSSVQASLTSTHLIIVAANAMQDTLPGYSHRTFFDDDLSRQTLLAPLPQVASPSDVYAAYDEIPLPYRNILQSIFPPPPLVCSIVPHDGSLHDLSATFAIIHYSSDAAQVPVNPAQIQQEAMSISYALPHIQLKIGSSDSDSLLEGMFDSGAGLNVGSRYCHEAITKKNPHLVTGIHRFEY